MNAGKIRKIAKKYGIALVYLFGSQAENGARYLERMVISNLNTTRILQLIRFIETCVLITMAGYRNRMVHFYREVTPQELYQIAKDNLKDIEHFTREIALFIKNYQKKKK